MSPKTSCLPTTNLTPEITRGSGPANPSLEARPTVLSSCCSMISMTRIVSPVRPTLTTGSARNRTTTQWDERVQGTVNPISPFLLGLLPEFTLYTGCGISPNSRPLIQRISNCTRRVWMLKSLLAMALLLHRHLHLHQRMHQLLLRRMSTRGFKAQLRRPQTRPLPRRQSQAVTPTIRPLL